MNLVSDYGTSPDYHVSIEKLPLRLAQCPVQAMLLCCLEPREGSYTTQEIKASAGPVKVKCALFHSAGGIERIA